MGSKAKKVFGLAFAILVSLGVVASGCIGGSSSTQTQSAEKTEGTSTTSEIQEKTLTIYTSIILGNPYFNYVIDGMKVAANEIKEKKGINVELKFFDSGTDPAKQTTQIESFISSGVDGIVVVPISDAVAPSTKSAMKQGIPVVLVDRDYVDVPGAKEEYRLVSIHTDNRKAAQDQAKLLIKHLQQSGKKPPWKIVILNGLPGVYTLSVRKQGFHDVLDPWIQNGTIKVVAEQYTDSDKLEETYKLAQNVLAATNADFDAVITGNNLLAMGFVKALKDRGLDPSKYIIIGFDAQPEDMVKMVKNGELTATNSQAPFLMGYWAVWTLYYYKFHNWKPPSSISTPIVYVTKENLDTFGGIVNKPHPLSEYVSGVPEDP